MNKSPFAPKATFYSRSFTPVLCPEEGLTKCFCPISRWRLQESPYRYFTTSTLQNCILISKWTLSVLPALPYSLRHGEEIVPSLLTAFCIFEHHCHAFRLSHFFFSSIFRLHSTGLSSLSLRDMSCITMTSSKMKETLLFSFFAWWH